MPIWLAYEEELRLCEENGRVIAGVPAIGTWPAAGATVNLFALRRAAEAVVTETVEIVALENAVLIATKRGHFSLPLLEFGSAKNGHRR